MGILSTDPYKGVRDFYPDDMAVQQFIFTTWAQTAESFGFVRYDASILEPSELYKSKGAENEELVNEQTYTFTDRGDREVTLRPEMTPTVARMIAGKRKELAFPVRWYSIPNLFRYERAQRGRLREHWQLNCDIFGTGTIASDIEIIALADQIFKNFGATSDMYEIRVNDRREMKTAYESYGINDSEIQSRITRLNDRFRKIDESDYLSELTTILDGDTAKAEAVLAFVRGDSNAKTENEVVQGLKHLGIENVSIDRSLARGFDYYTGTIFEIFDTDPDNNRALLGGGRYDNLTSLFGGEAITGIGFGMGDVTMRDFLATHNLLTLDSVRAGAEVVILPADPELVVEAERVAYELRQSGKRVSVDLSGKKLGKQIADANERGALYIVVVGVDEVANGTYALKRLSDGSEFSGMLADIRVHLAA